MRILRGLSSKLLACGCVAGVYETYDGRVVTVIDATSPSCADKHTIGKVVPAETDAMQPAPIRSTSSGPR